MFEMEIISLQVYNLTNEGANGYVRTIHQSEKE
jgi:hypothetical protein